MLKHARNVCVQNLKYIQNIFKVTAISNYKKLQILFTNNHKFRRKFRSTKYTELNYGSF